MVSRSIWFCLVNISFFVILILILLSCFRLMHWTSSEMRFSSSVSLVLRYWICLSSTSALWAWSFDFSNSKGVRVCKVFCCPEILCLSPLLTIMDAVPWLAVPSPASTSSNFLKFVSFWSTSKSCWIGYRSLSSEVLPRMYLYVKLLWWESSFKLFLKSELDRILSVSLC